MKDPVARAIGRAAEGYVYTDIYEEAIDSLEMTARFLKETESDPRRWKWVIIALQTAVQNFMVLVVKGTWDVATQHRDIRNKKLQAHYNLTQAIESGDEEAIQEAREKDREAMFMNQLDSFDRLYERVKDEDHWAMQYLGNDEAFVPGISCDESMRRLKLLRHDYMHFPDAARFHGVAILAQIAVDGLSVIEFLMGRDRLIGWRPDNEHRLRAAVAFADAKESAAQLAEKFPMRQQDDSETSGESSLTFGQRLQQAMETFIADDKSDNGKDEATC